MQDYGVVFSWSFDIACNFRCPYCYFDGRWAELAPDNKRPPLEVVLEAWRKVHERYGRCMVMFAGGEPTVYPRFDELLIGLSRWHRWVINTNLTWGPERWEALARRLDPKSGDIYTSFHPTEKMDLARFIERAVLLKKLGFWGNATIVTYPPVLPELRRYHDAMRKAGLDVRPQPFVGKFEGRDYPEAYSKEEKAVIAELSGSGNSTLSEELPYAIGDASPLGRLCHAGQSYCMIDRAGDIYRCLQVGPRPEEKLGNLYTGFEMKTQPAPCPMTFCSCGESMWLVDNRPRH